MARCSELICRSRISSSFAMDSNSSIGPSRLRQTPHHRTALSRAGLPSNTQLRRAAIHRCSNSRKERAENYGHRREISRRLSTRTLHDAEEVEYSITDSHNRQSGNCPAVIFRCAFSPVSATIRSILRSARKLLRESEAAFLPTRALRLSPMSNINGKVYAMNAITPMKPWKTWILRAFLEVLSEVKPLQADLINLSFIEFARWVVLPREHFPFLGQGQKREELQYDYLLFFSNFNGTWNQYIDAFSAVLSNGLNLIWRWSEKFPGSVPVTLFKEYIARVQFDTDYYYTAYPQAAANDVKSAHIVQAAFDNLAQQSPNLNPQQFAAAYLQFVIQVQSHLGETSEAPVVF